MDTKLTHEQSLLLRACTMLNVFYERRTARRLAWLIDKDLVYSDRSRRGALTITMMGEAALAAYDAEWVTVRRTDAQAIIDADDSGDCGRMLKDVAVNFRSALETKP